MVFKLTMQLQDKQAQRLMPFNYHYPLSWAIHNIIRKSDPEFATFFHNVGYSRVHDAGFTRERFKLFTFSDISVPFTSKGDRMLLLAENATLKVCFHVPEAAQHFIKGLFAAEYITIEDEISRVIFRVQEVQDCTINLSHQSDEVISVVVQPSSPLVVSGRRPDKSPLSAYYSPCDKPFVDRLIFSWLQKYKAASQADNDIDNINQKIRVQVLFFSKPPAERLVIIKAGRDNVQKIKGYTQFRLKLTAPKKMIELALNSGLGVKNSMGMGCLDLIY